MLGSRASRLSLGVLVLGLLLAACWVGWHAWQVNRALVRTVADAATVRAAVQAGDVEQIERTLARLRASSREAATRTSSATWSLLTRAPVLGDDARGVRVAAEVVDGLAHEGVAPLVEVTSRLDSLLPVDGTVPVDAISDLAAPVEEARSSFAAADAALAVVDPSGFDARLRTSYSEMASQVAQAAATMDAAGRAIDLLPRMLGQDGPRQYLLVFQNNAEVRATGGLPGAVMLLRAEGGALSIERQAAGASFGRADRPVLPLSEAERDLYDDVPASYFVSANMGPDVPRVADLMAARWRQVFPQDSIDGVVLVDTVALGYLLDAVGPLAVDGVTLTGATVVDELLHNTYLRLADPYAQDEFFAEVARAGFETFSAGQGDPAGMIRALARATEERRLSLRSFDAEEQEAVAGSAIAGELVTDPAEERPQVDVTVNDTTGAKMSYYLRHEVDIDATYCTDGVQGLSAKMRLRSEAPADAADLPEAVTGGGRFATDPGNQLVTVRLFGPVGGAIDDVSLNAGPLELIEVNQDGRPVGMTYIELAPGQTVDLTWTMTSGQGQTGDIDLGVTPGVLPGSDSGTVPSAC